MASLDLDGLQRILATNPLQLFNLANVPSYSNDAEAAAGGVPIGQMYRNGNFVMVRIS